MESRTNTALFKRAEQLKRWEESETNKEPADLRKDKSRRVKFSNGCVFLAACASGDKEEVERLLEEGADINTANVDGLTALHQACIDDNLEMVEFLVEQGCDINRGDNEGWTPLHATASCGFISIAKFLIENGANVAAVNNDGELPIDIAESEEMEELLQAEIDKQGIDCDAARSEEERIMIEDAKQWLNNRRVQDKVHPKTGATALHVAAAKGYIKVISLLIQGGADINAQDNDGWTPLHAAAHWGQREACEILAENLANMDIKNYAGQSCFDVAEPELVKLLEELKKKQATLQKEKPEITAILQKKSAQPLKRRTSVTRMSGADKSNVVMKDTSQERAQIEAKLRLAETIKEEKDRKIYSGSETDESETEDANQKEALEVARRNEANRADSLREKEIMPAKIEKVVSEEATQEPAKQEKPTPAAVPEVANEVETDVAPWRRGMRRPLASGDTANAVPSASVTQPVKAKEEVPVKPSKAPEAEQEAVEKKNVPENPPVAEKVNGPTTEIKDKKRPQGSNPTIYIPPPADLPVSTATTPSTTPSTTPNSSAPTSPVSSSVPLSLMRRSYVPPVRDEESETQRKAHAKRVRETRRSTQRVTLEDVKSAEQQLLKKQQEESPKKENKEEAVQKKETQPPSVAAKDTVNQEKRISWRARIEEGAKDERPSHRKAHDRNSVSGTSSIDSAITQVQENVESPDVSVTIPSKNKLQETTTKEEENDNKTGTQAAIQRRKRPKRRSTGVVHMEGDENTEEENSVHDGHPEENTEKQAAEENKGTSDRLRSRYGSTSSLQDNRSESSSRYSSRASSVYSSTASLNEDAEKDLRKLYQEIKEENEKLREKVSKMEDELQETKRQLEKALQNNLRNSLSDTEKRERRALERKVSEMEEELKNLAKLKAENEKLRSENRALTRVISKMSNK